MSEVHDERKFAEARTQTASGGAMTTIRAFSVAGALLALAAVEARQAGAEIYRPWCVQYFGNGRTSCAFDSFEQCMETARGNGAYCHQNPWYLQYGSSQAQGADLPQAEPDKASAPQRVARKKPAPDPRPRPVFR
jgi:Protein of unknown function (DUF3551)